MNRDLADLLDATLAAIRRFVVVGDAELDTLALFVAHTWTYQAAGAQFTPYIWISSPVKRAGKTTLLDVLRGLVREPVHQAGITEAYLFRRISENPLTLLLDEIDTVFKEKPSDSTEGLRAVINAGHRSGTTVGRCVPPSMVTKDFATFCPKVIAGIGGHLPETIVDRSIRIRLERKTAADTVERARAKYVDRAAGPVREGWESIADDLAGLLADAEPDVPDELDDRAADVWDPLLAIADAAGNDWPARAREAAVRLSTGEQREDTSLGVLLLAGVRFVLGDAPAIFSRELVRRLADDAESPFVTWVKDGEPQDWAQRRLAAALKEFGIKSKNVRVGEIVRKGYTADQLADVFARYLDPPTVTHVAEVTP